MQQSNVEHRAEATFDPAPGFGYNPWRYHAAGDLQGRQDLGLLAGKAGAALAPAGALTRNVAGLDPASIIVAGAFIGGASGLVIYLRRRLDYRKLQSAPRRPVRVSDAQLYGRYKALTAALEESGLQRKWHETPEEYARRAAQTTNEPAVERLGEIYLHTRFRDAVPAALVEEFNDLEPTALAAAHRLARAETANK